MQFGHIARTLATCAVVGACGSTSPDREGATETAAEAVNLSDYLTPPGAHGERVHRSCVHAVPDGAHVAKNGDVSVGGVVVASYPGKCPYAPLPPLPGNGWVEDSVKHAPNAGYHLNYIQNQWTVPSAPTTGSALIYLWQGLETEDRHVVVQPVLQYGSGYFGGAYWTMTSWYVNMDNGHRYYNASYLVLSPGDVVRGTVSDVTRGIGCTDVGVRITSEDLTTGLSNSGTVEWEPYEYAFSNVLEAYTINACSDFPATNTTFTDPILQEDIANNCSAPINANTSQFAWGHEFWWNTAGEGFPNCGYNIVNLPVGGYGGGTLVY